MDTQNIQNLSSQEITSEISEPIDGTDQESVGVSLLMAILMSLLSVVIGLAFYHFTLAPKEQKFSVIDLQSINATLENEARKTIVDNVNATEADRNSAAILYESKMKALQATLNQIGNECSCVLVVKAAILNNSNNKRNNIVDYTAEAREKLGLNDTTSSKATP